MQLQFEYTQDIGTGSYSDLIHLWDNEANNLYIKDGRMRSQYAYTPNGEWEDRIFEGDVDVSVHDNIESFRIDNMGGWGAIGAYKQNDNPVFPDDDKHYLLIYEYQHDMSEYLSSGSIKHSANTPISTFSLSLKNPVDLRTENDENIAISENKSLLSPGAKVIFKFKMGTDIEEIELGTFYIDRSQFSLLSSTVSADGRNLLGKALRDQSLNENNIIPFQALSTTIREMLLNANIPNNKIVVEETAEERRFDFTPNKEVLGALEEVMKAMIDWKIEEDHEGRIGVGNPDYSFFPTRSVYTFYRDKDIFSRQITRDDQEAYKKVCVHTNDWSIARYKDVEAYSGWNLQDNKTLFVSIADGTSLLDAQAIATELAGRLENVGKIESFNSPFRPQLLVGDEARIIADDGATNLGLITEITHSFGESGFYTNFTVDSGGRLGRGRLSDFISLISKAGQVGSIAYADIIPDTPVLADLTDYNATLSSVTELDYTPASWLIYQAVVTANVMTTSNTQTQVDLATIKIELAQNKLVLI